MLFPPLSSHLSLSKMQRSITISGRASWKIMGWVPSCRDICWRALPMKWVICTEQLPTSLMIPRKMWKLSWLNGYERSLTGGRTFLGARTKATSAVSRSTTQSKPPFTHNDCPYPSFVYSSSWDNNFNYNERKSNKAKPDSNIEGDKVEEERFASCSQQFLQAEYFNKQRVGQQVWVMLYMPFYKD